MATPDPYQSRSGAPKHWVDVPAQRQRPPAPEQLDAALQSGAGEDTGSRAEWGVAAIALGVAVAAFVLIGSDNTATEADPAPPQRTSTTP